MFDRSIMSRFWLVEASRLCGLTYRRPRVAMFGISGDEVVGLEACHGWELEQRGCLDVDVLMQTAHVRQSSNRHQHASERLGQRGPEPKRRIGTRATTSHGSVDCRVGRRCFSADRENLGQVSCQPSISKFGMARK